MGAPLITDPTPARTLAAIRQMVEEIPGELAWPPGVHFKHRGVQPPAAQYITQSDFLVHTGYTAAANLPGTLNLFMLDSEGKPVYNRFAVAAPTVSSVTTSIFPLCEGFLVGLTFNVPTSNVRRGTYWASIGLQFGSATGNTPYRVLVADYVTQNSPLAWPGGRINQNAEGAGMETTAASANPAVNTEITFTVPQQRLRLQSLYWTLVTDVNVANRQVDLIVDDATNILYRTGAAAAQTASTTLNYSAGAGVPPGVSAAGTVVMALPVGLMIAPNYRIRTQTTNLQVGDDYSAMRVYGESWMETP